MTNKQIDTLEKEMSKTHHVFKKNKASEAKINNIVSFAKGLSSEQLIIFIARFIILISPHVHRKKLSKLLNDSEIVDMGIDINLLLEEIYSFEEKKILKVKDLLKG